MSTLLYSPGIRVVIQTAGHGIIDVSDDLNRGSLTLTENQPGTFNFSIINHRRKYDGIFTPNDLVSVQMKRIRWLPVFAGYLNEVPYFSVYPRSVQLSASDTLKRLRRRLWDPGAPASYELLNNSRSNSRRQTDGGLRDTIIALMTEVADWPARTVHIGAIPSDWNAKMSRLKDKMSDSTAIDPSTLGTSGVIGGSTPLTGSTTTQAAGPGTGALPYSSAQASWFGGPGGGAYGMMQLTGESGISPRDPWYIAMRWPYASQTSRGGTPAQGLTMTDYRNAIQWWKNRKVVVFNPKNNRAIVCRAADWGPWYLTGKGIDLSRHALETALGAKTGDTLEVRFADPNAPLGVATSSAAGAPGSPTAGPPAPSGGGGSSQPAATPATVQAASGTRWTGADNLKPHVAAARAFIRANWSVPLGIGGYANRNIAGTNTPSLHSLGRALDVMVSSGEPNASQLALGNAVAQWFAANPRVFGTTEVIWRDKINTGSGWRPYGPSARAGGRHPSPTQGHRDHPHLSFDNANRTSAGPMGGGWPGSSPQEFAAAFSGSLTAGQGVDVGAGGGGTSGFEGMPLINAFDWSPRQDPVSSILTGPRAVMNDVPLLGSIATLCGASMRSFMAAPNGDFIAWFPDYFGVYGTAGKLTVRDIELARDGFTLNWSDNNLVTHQFTAGATSGYTFGTMPTQPMVDAYRRYQTAGIATVEYPEIMEALFNVNRADPRAKNFLDPQAILQRFGASVDYKAMGYITGPEAEFWYACHLLQRSWASQFSSKVELTFMPEAWPGMLLHLESFKFQAYVEQVTHEFSFEEGGGFNTSVRVIAPSATGGGLYALPRAGNYSSGPTNSNRPVYGMGPL